MSEVNLERMIEICKRFVDSNPIDFYQLFEIDKNMNLMEINKDIKNKRIRALFHLDQIGVVPEEYKGVFQKISNSIPDLVNAFSTRENRSKYDSNLTSSKTLDEELEKKSIIITAKDKNNLEYSVIQTAIKYGWKHIVDAIVEFINNNSASRFTRTGDARDIITQLGADKVREIVMSSSYNDIDNNVNLTIQQVVANYISEMFQTNQFLRQQADAITAAIVNTMDKYNPSQAYSQESGFQY